MPRPENAWSYTSVPPVLLNGAQGQLKEIGWESMDWMHLVQDRYEGRVHVNTAMGLRVPQKAKNFLTR